jgi:hypothetical protein
MLTNADTRRALLPDSAQGVESMGTMSTRERVLASLLVAGTTNACAPKAK